MTITIRSRHGLPIATLDDWKRHASTDGKWADGYSAKELARLWLDGSGAAAVEEALAPALRGLRLHEAIAEAQVSFDQHKGGVRNHDVLVFGRCDAGPVVIGIEGKVNESLDDTINGKYAAAARRRRQSKNTNLDTRVDELLARICGSSVTERPELGELRYQLFSAIAGTVAAARKDTVAAAVVVHLVRSPLALPEKFIETRDAVARFARAVGADPGAPVLGPVAVRGALPCWLAVVETDAAADTAAR